MKFEKTESQKILSYIEKYKLYAIKIDELQKKILELMNIKENLLYDLTETRNSEKDFITELEKKYNIKITEENIKDLLWTFSI